MKAKYVIDANVLFGESISGRAVSRLLFSERSIYMPDYAFSELEKYKARILKKTKLREQDLREFVITLLRNVTVIPNFLISEASLKKAYQLCKDIDEKDTVYIASAIEFHAILITNDKILYSGLKERNFDRVKLLEDAINQLFSESED